MVTIGNEQQVGSTQRPHAAEADFHACQLVESAGEYRSLVRFAVAVGIFQHDDPILLRRVEVHFAFGIGVALGDPQPSALVGRNRDRLLHVRLVSEQLDAKPFRHLHLGQRFLRSQQRRRDLLRVLRSGNLVATTDGAHSPDRNCGTQHASDNSHPQAPSPSDLRKTISEAAD